MTVKGRSIIAAIVAFVKKLLIESKSFKVEENEPTEDG